MKYLIAVVFFFFAIVGVHAANRTDSLERALSAAPVAQKIDLLNQLSEAYRGSNTQKSLDYALEALKLSQAQNDQKKLAISKINVGVIYRNQGDSKTALNYFISALDIASRIKDRRIEADVLHKLCVIHLFLKEYPQALRFAEKAETIWRDLNDAKGLAATLNAEGLIYSNMKNNELALSKLNESLQLAEIEEDKELMYKPLGNIGDVYYKMGQSDKAIEYIGKSLKLSEELKNQLGIASGMINMSKAYLLKKDYRRAIDYQYSALKMATEIQSMPLVRNSYGLLAQSYEELGEYKKALHYHKLYKNFEDSLSSQKSQQQMAELEARYEGEKKAQRIKELTSQNEFSSFKVYALSALVLLALMLLAIAYNRYRLKQNSNLKLMEINEEITQQSEEIVKQKNIIEQINVNLTDSISYARRIQNALFPTHAGELSVFSEYFVLNMPKDIVSGDFCWFSRKGDQVMMVLGDCTGHGVPGAFLTVMCNSLLVEIINQLEIFKPSAILEELNRRINHLLHQQESHNNEGMDVAICNFNVQTRELMYAGAKTPLYYFKNGELSVIKADRAPVGGTHYAEIRTYTNYHLQLEKGDTFYMSSDGYQDQFGGQNNRKFLVKNFRQLLIDLQPENMERQKTILKETKTNWQGRFHQTDDIMVLGVRV